MVVKIYGHPTYTSTARVLVCLEEVGAEYEVVTVDLTKGEHKTPAYLARNPFGVIPALEDGEFKLFESRAISKYILRKYKGSGSDLLQEGKIEESSMVDLGVEIEAHHYNPAISPIVYQCLVVPARGGTPDQKIIDASVEAASKVLDVYEARLSTSKYLAGDSFTFADLSHFPYTHYLMAGTPYASLITSRPHVKAWWEDMAARPAFVKVAAAMRA
ncbi:probable glutathione S-transferase GSTF1 [Typha angustifolia]|uniref:probable glutathione S-transferase GSTF1 n=1 Tax=Typha angustifolia TaxID=59011 RepID=UPI003C2FB703